MLPSIPTPQDSSTLGGKHWLATEWALDSALCTAARSHVLTAGREKALPAGQRKAPWEQMFVTRF